MLHNIYLLCNDKPEFALPGYFIQSVKVDKKQTSLLLSLLLLKQAEHIVPTERIVLHISYCSNESALP